MKMTEYERLRFYFVRAHNRVHNLGFHAIAEEDCDKMFQRLVPSERPDMYAELDDKIIILEHFEFDASRNTRKGMKGRAEEARLEQRLKDVPMDCSVHIDTARYEMSIQDWQTNFERTFKKHYDRIDAYKEHVTEQTSSYGKPIRVGFLIEQELSPFINIGCKLDELPYFKTRQFAEVIQNSPKLDFILFCGYLGGVTRITYRDREALHKDWNNLVDLREERVSWSHLNGNDFVMFGGFEITREDLERAFGE